MLSKRLVTAATFVAWMSLLASALPAAAQTAPSTDPTAQAQAAATVVGTTSEVPPAPKKMTTVEAIRKARAMLKALLAEDMKRKPQPYAVPNASTAHVTLAVWNRNTDVIDLVGAEKYGDSLTITSGPKLPISVTFSARLNSQYALPPETNSVVVGGIYPIISKQVVKKKTTYSAMDLVYVPYSPEFYTPQMLAAGSDYLSFMIQEAYDELRAKGIKSRAYPDKLLADVIDPYLVKSIAIIEHSDTHSLTKQDDQDRAIGRFLVKLAINEEETFGTAVSTAGAAGLVQFIPSTYALMVRNHTELGLIPDFRKGMADHKNAVKAQIAYIDSDLSGMATVRALYLTDKSRAAEYLAASYNGGTTRVKRAYTTFGDDWSKSYRAQLASANANEQALKTRILGLLAQVKKGKDVKANNATIAKLRSQRAAALSQLATLEKSSLREETVGYVAKLRHAYAMLTAGYFATPNAPSGALPTVAVVASTASAAPAALASAGIGQVCFGDGSCVANQ